MFVSSSPSLASSLEALRQQALQLNASCLVGTYAFGEAYKEFRVSVCDSLQADVDMLWLTLGLSGMLSVPPCVPDILVSLVQALGFPELRCSLGCVCRGFLESVLF